MKLWIFHHYATLPNLNGHIRPFRFAKHLHYYNIETTIFAASFQHFSGNNLITNGESYIREEVDKIPFVFIKTPNGSNGLARIRNMLAFYQGLKAVCYKYANLYGKPDCILASSPQPLSMQAGIEIAKKIGIPCICEIRDLWPEAIFNVSNRVKENTLIGKALIAGEHSIYKKANALIFTKEGDTDYLKEHEWTSQQGGDINLNKCFYINNGIEIDEYLNQIDSCSFFDKDLEDSSFKLIYAGAIRPVNNVSNILDAAKFLKNENVKILIYGEGSQKQALEQKAIDEHIDNVSFKGFVEKKYLPYILSKSSANLLNYSSKHYNWSRGISSNKLFEYLASGKPVISTVKTGYSIVEKNHCGIELQNQSPRDLADAIVYIKNLPSSEYENFCLNALNTARQFDYGLLTKKLVNVIKTVA